jgi:hypothetical protein
MRRFVFLIPLLLSAGEIDPQAYLKHVQYLASPELKGRATGSPELEKAGSRLDLRAGVSGDNQRAPGDQQSFSISRRQLDGFAHL